MADEIYKYAGSDTYGASVLPILLFRAERYDDLMHLGLEEIVPDSNDPVEKREILLRRMQYAINAALAMEKPDDAAKLFLRAGEEVAADDRQFYFLIDHADLVSSLAGAHVVNDFIFRRRVWSLVENGYLSCAAMLATEPHNFLEAKQFLSLAEMWLQEWFAHQREKKNEEHQFERETFRVQDIAVHAEVVRSVHGRQAMTRFFSNWRDWATFEAVGIVTARLLDKGKYDEVTSMLYTFGDRVAPKLAVIQEMSSVCITPSKSAITNIVSHLTSEETRLDLDEYSNQEKLLCAVITVAEFAAKLGISKPKIIELLDCYPVPNDRVLRSYDGGYKREAVLRAASLRAVLDGRQPTINDVTPDSIKSLREKSSSDDHSEVRDFKEIYGALIPWHGLRALALANKSSDWANLVSTAQRNCLAERKGWGWGNNSDMEMAVNDIGRVWLEATIWSNNNNEKSVADIERWLTEQKVMIFIPTWTTLIRLSACHSKFHYDATLSLASRALELIEDSREDGRETANNFAALARALLPMDQEEASRYFQRGIESLDRLGEELHTRLSTLLALAEAAGKSDQPDPKEAYRVARMAELFNSFNDHKFPWDDVIVAVASLCPASAFAVLSRWHDRGQTSVGRTLPTLVLHLRESQKISPSIACALHAFGGYWEIRNQGNMFFDRRDNNEVKQKILNFLVKDQELDRSPAPEEANVLLELANMHALHVGQLETIASVRSRYAESVQKPPQIENKKKFEPQTPNWGELFSNVNLLTSGGVDQVIKKRQSMNAHSHWSEFLSQMRKRIRPIDRKSHVGALAHSTELSIDLTLEALEACRNDWGGSLVVDDAVSNVTKTVLVQRAKEVFEYSWKLDDRLRRWANLSGLDPKRALAHLMKGVAHDIENVPSRTLFNLARATTSMTSDPNRAKDVLVFGLDRLEVILKDSDGDGTWHDGLAPPTDIQHAVAGFIYAMLASPDATIRWRAAHSVRRLCCLGENQCVSMLFALLASEKLTAFTDARFPFYAMHARLFLLIAFSRAAVEAPQAILCHAKELVRWAVEQPPHVLIQHFAALAALKLEEHQSGLIERSDLQKLKLVNKSPFPVQPRDTKQTVGWTNASGDESCRFHFDYDFDRYWFGPLSSVFNLSNPKVLKYADKWITDRWSVSNASDWNSDLRARRGLYGRDVHASHGSYPKVDRFSFYLSYHSMFCTAGELLNIYPTSSEFSWDGWRHWLSSHLLTRSDGRWLADRRDFEPLEAGAWRFGDGQSEDKDGWPYSVMSGTFDQVLGIKDEISRRIPVWGTLQTTRNQCTETVRVSSSLASPRTSTALLRALQTASNTHQYKIPVERDMLEIDLPGFQLCGWISERHTDPGLDVFDPFAAGIPWPGPRPGRRARHLLKLVGDVNGREWKLRDALAVKLQIWGDHSDGRDASGNNYGNWLTADLHFLLEMLGRVNRDLIIEVDITRSVKYRETSEIDYPFRSNTRLYLLRGDGQIYTLYGSRSLRPKAN